jgi:hypothetical protein
MAGLDTEGREKAMAAANVPLGPVLADAGHADLGASVAFTIGSAGDSFVATATGLFHLVCGASGVVATTSCPVFDGAVRLVLPDGCTHVAMLEAAVDVFGCAYRG